MNQPYLHSTFTKSLWFTTFFPHFPSLSPSKCMMHITPQNMFFLRMHTHTHKKKKEEDIQHPGDLLADMLPPVMAPSSAGLNKLFENGVGCRAARSAFDSAPPAGMEATSAAASALDASDPHHHHHHHRRRFGDLASLPPDTAGRCRDAREPLDLSMQTTTTTNTANNKELTSRYQQSLHQSHHHHLQYRQQQQQQYQYHHHLAPQLLQQVTPVDQAAGDSGETAAVPFDLACIEEESGKYVTVNQKLFDCMLVAVHLPMSQCCSGPSCTPLHMESVRRLEYMLGGTFEWLESFRCCDNTQLLFFHFDRTYRTWPPFCMNCVDQRLSNEKLLDGVPWACCRAASFQVEPACGEVVTTYSPSAVKCEWKYPASDSAVMAEPQPESMQSLVPHNYYPCDVSESQPDEKCSYPALPTMATSLDDCTMVPMVATQIYQDPDEKAGSYNADAYVLVPFEPRQDVFWNQELHQHPSGTIGEAGAFIEGEASNELLMEEALAKGLLQSSSSSTSHHLPVDEPVNDNNNALDETFSTEPHDDPGISKFEVEEEEKEEEEEFSSSSNRDLGPSPIEEVEEKVSETISACNDDIVFNNMMGNYGDFVEIPYVAGIAEIVVGDDEDDHEDDDDNDDDGCRVRDTIRIPIPGCSSSRRDIRDPSSSPPEAIPVVAAAAGGEAGNRKPMPSENLKKTFQMLLGKPKFESRGTVPLKVAVKRTWADKYKHLLEKPKVVEMPKPCSSKILCNESNPLMNSKLTPTADDVPKKKKKKKKKRKEAVINQEETVSESPSTAEVEKTPEKEKSCAVSWLKVIEDKSLVSRKPFIQGLLTNGMSVQQFMKAEVRQPKHFVSPLLGSKFYKKNKDSRKPKKNTCKPLGKK